MIEVQVNPVETEERRAESASAEAAISTLSVSVPVIRVLRRVTKRQILESLRNCKELLECAISARAIINAFLIQSEDRTRKWMRSYGNARMSGIIIRMKTHIECAQRESTQGFTPITAV